MDGGVRLDLAEDGADAERIDSLARLLRQELLHLDVDDVVPVRAGAPPPGTRAFDVAAVGSLMVLLGQSATGLDALVTAIRGWMTRGGGVRRTVRVEIDGDVLELSDATAADQERVVAMFLRRHSARRS